MGLFSLGIPFIYFGSQVKQYSSDVLFAILVLFAVIEIRRKGVTATRAWLLGLVGAATAWFSQPVLFVLAGTGAGLLIVVLGERDGRAIRALLVTWALWGVSAFGAAAFAMRNVSAADTSYFREFWAEGFMPWPPTSVADVFWVFKKLTWAFGSFGSGMHRLTGGLNYRWSWLFTVLLLLGVWALWTRRRDAALFVVLPVLLTAALSAAQFYPFTARLFAFLLPGLLLATAAGVDWVLAAIPARLTFLAPVVLAVAGGAPLFAAATTLPPSWLQPLRPIVEEIRARRGPGDVIYVYHAAGQAFYYYADRYALSLERVMMGQCPTHGPRDLLYELDQLRGRSRVWVIFTHTRNDGADGVISLDYLDRIGRRLQILHRPGTSGHPLEAAYAVLYDLSDQSRLAAASADTYPIRSELVPESPSPFQCWGGVLPDSGRYSLRSRPR